MNGCKSLTVDRRKPRLTRKVLVGIATILLAAGAQAAGICTVSITGPAFGVYNPLNPAATTANGSVTATCTWTSGGSSNFTLASSYAAGNSGNLVTRYMLSGANRLDYNLYYDAGFTRIRGDGTGGSQTDTATLRVSRGQPTATSTSTIYGRIPPGQSAGPGSYSDTIIVTINY